MHFFRVNIVTRNRPENSLFLVTMVPTIKYSKGFLVSSTYIM